MQQDFPKTDATLRGQYQQVWAHPNAAADKAAAQQAFDGAFHEARAPRSAAYKAGTLACLQKRMCGAAFTQIYAGGTAESDAWLAGWDEGQLIFLGIKLHQLQIAQQAAA